MSLRGGRVLVVGASSGIGRCYAEQAASAGAKVAVAARRAELLDELADRIGGLPIVMDVTDGSSVVAGVDRAVQRLGGLDVLLIAAGISPLALLADSDADVWRRIYDVNVIGPNLVLRSAVRHLGSDGVALVVSSDGVGEPRSGLGMYNASKAALNETLDVWRVEHPELRLVRVSVGPTSGTDIGREIDVELAGRLLPDWIARAQLPASFMAAEDVAAAILALSCAARGSTAIPHELLLKPCRHVMTAEGVAGLQDYLAETSEMGKAPV